MDRLVLPLPDDLHIHLRQGLPMEAFARDAATQFGRVLVMPNTLPPIVDVAGLHAYRDAIVRAAPSLQPLMTFKLHPRYTKDELMALHAAGAVAAKYYPAGVTTNSADGISEFDAVLPVIAEMERLGLVLSLHGEEPSAFCLDREERFLDKVVRLHKEFPQLRIVLEHLSTNAAVCCVQSLGPNVGATITVHHMLHSLDDVLGGSLSPHLFCKPLLKRPEDRDALRTAAFSGDTKFFLGTDSAPHDRHAKECSCGAAGVYSAPVAMPLLAELFESAGRLDALEAFACRNGALFYGLPKQSRKLTLVREAWAVPVDCAGVVPLAAGKTLSWKVEGIS